MLPQVTDYLGKDEAEELVKSKAQALAVSACVCVRVCQALVSRGLGRNQSVQQPCMFGLLVNVASLIHTVAVRDVPRFLTRSCTSAGCIREFRIQVQTSPRRHSGSVQAHGLRMVGGAFVCGWRFLDLLQHGFASHACLANESFT
jgi:hypothetical protein